MSVRDRQAHTVYRCYDAEGLLLYIGQSHNVKRRLIRHRNSGTPASSVLTAWMVRHTEVEYPTRWDSIFAERRAIRLEAPLLNTTHQKIGNTAASRLAVICAYVAYATQREADNEAAS